MSLKPLEDKIVIKRNKQEEKTSSGLIIAGKDEQPNEGTVVAVGPGITLQSGEKIVPDVKPGDVVLFSKFGGTEVSHQGEDFLIITIRDLLAVISND